MISCARSSQGQSVELAKSKQSVELRSWLFACFQTIRCGETCPSYPKVTLQRFSVLLELLLSPPQHKLHNHNFYLDKIKVLEIVRKLESLAYYINKITTILILGDESRLCTSSSWRTKRHRDEYAFYFCPYYIIIIHII